MTLKIPAIAGIFCWSGLEKVAIGAYMNLAVAPVSSFSLTYAGCLYHLPGKR